MQGSAVQVQQISSSILHSTCVCLMYDVQIMQRMVSVCPRHPMDQSSCESLHLCRSLSLSILCFCHNIWVVVMTKYYGCMFGMWYILGLGMGLSFKLCSVNVCGCGRDTIRWFSDTIVLPSFSELLPELLVIMNNGSLSRLLADILSMCWLWGVVFLKILYNWWLQFSNRFRWSSNSSLVF